MPALVALDRAPSPRARRAGRRLARSSSSACRPGVEDDSLEQHVVEADALTQPRCGPPRAPRSSRAAAPRRARASRAGRSSRAAARALVRRGLAGSPSTSPAMRSKSRAWRCSSRRWRKKTQAIRLSWEASGLPVRRVDERREVLGDRILGHAEAGEKRGQALTAPVRKLRPRAGVGGPGRWPPHPTACGPRPGRRSSGQKLRFANVSNPPTSLYSPQRAGRPGWRPSVPGALVIHGATVASALRRSGCPPPRRVRAARRGERDRAR